MNKGVVIGCSIAGVVLLLVGLCAGGVALVIGSAVGTIAAVGKPADDFLTLLGKGDTTGAYNSGASGLRAAESQEEFADFVKKARLDQYSSSKWNSFNINNAQGAVEGTVILKDGSVVPLKVNLVNEGGWKVAGLELTGGTKVSPYTPPAPAEADAKAMVARDMAAFRKAVETDDFAPLYATFCQKWKSETTAAGVREAYKQFVEGKADLTGVGKVPPTLTKSPTVDADGRLTLTGEYPSRPMKVGFELEYVYEGKAWKLSGIYASVKRAE